MLKFKKRFHRAFGLPPITNRDADLVGMQADMVFSLKFHGSFQPKLEE
jgi:hypothetical protein